MVKYQIIDYSPEYYQDLNRFWNELGLGGSHRGDNEIIISETIKFGGHLILMINEVSKIIGTSWLTNDKRRTYLHHFGISKEYQKQGLASKLLEYSMVLAANDGLQIKLEVHKENESAIKLYSKYGFNYLGDYEVLINRQIGRIEL
jgi:ribosomal protein S18 acetylase RimI-like enzyme